MNVFTCCFNALRGCVFPEPFGPTNVVMPLCIVTVMGSTRFIPACVRLILTVDNVFVERLWRSVKYEDVYLRAYATPTELRAGLDRYFKFYNTRRRHSALDRRTPDAVYFDLPGRTLAA